MNALEAESVVVMGGPLEGTDVLLVMRADTAEDIVKRLSGDPWTGLDLFRIHGITPWTLRLGASPCRSERALVLA